MLLESQKHEVFFWNHVVRVANNSHCVRTTQFGDFEDIISRIGGPVLMKKKLQKGLQLKSTFS